MDKFLTNTEDLLKQLFIDYKGFMDYLHDSGHLYYNFEPSEEEFKEKLDIFEINETDEPKDLQDIPIKAIHQTTLRYLYNDSKDDLMAAPPTQRSLLELQSFKSEVQQKL